MSLIRQAWRSAFRRRDLRPIYEWARDNTDLKAPLTLTGPFDVSRSRHFIAPFEALQDDHVREVNVRKPVRGGGTLIADIWVPWCRVNDPGPTLFVLQTDPLADDHFNKILLPTMESVPAIREMLEALPADAKQKRKIEYADGNQLHCNGPAISNLQTNAFRYVVEDECWLYPERIGEADGRVGDFLKLETSKILRISQGGPKPKLDLDKCSWHRVYNMGEQNEWEVCCPHCGQFYEPKFAGVRDDGSFWGIVWDKHLTGNGDWDIAKCVPTVRFECPHCRRPVMDGARTKSEWNRTGKYKVVGETKRKRKSFHWEAVIDFPWDELCELWLSAENAFRRGDIMPKLQFYQKRRALDRDENSLLKASLNLIRSTYEVNSEWPEEKGRFMSIDRQEEDVFWWSVRAWSLGKTRRLGFGRAFGFAELEEIRKKLKTQPNHTFCDSAFQPKGDHGVYAACLQYGWVALRGDDKPEFVHHIKRGGKVIAVMKSYSSLTWGDPGSGTSKNGRRYAPLILFSKYQMNALVQRLIDSGAWEEPAANEADEMEREYNEQMASRVRMVEHNKKTGRETVIWKETKNDHARDLANMQAAGAVMAKFISDPIADQLTKSEQQPTEPQTA